MPILISAILSFGLGMATATRHMRDRVERIMKEGLACDCCSAEIKALFIEWIENRVILPKIQTTDMRKKIVILQSENGT